MPSRRTTRARVLRQSSGLAEVRIWDRLRAGRLDGPKFRRQHPIGRYTVDFACDYLRLVIELDGGVHALEDVALKDLYRQRDLEALGWTVFRFSNEEALHHPERILAAIHRHRAALQ